jgi:hypothetical protein
MPMVRFGHDRSGVVSLYGSPWPGARHLLFFEENGEALGNLDDDLT